MATKKKTQPRKKKQPDFCESAALVHTTYTAFMQSKRYVEKLKLQIQNAEDRMNENEKMFANAFEKHNTDGRKFRK